VCYVDALQGSVTVQSQLHTEAQPQRHLSCGAASLVSVSGDAISCLPQSRQSRALLAVRTLMASGHKTDGQSAGQGRAANAAAHNTAHLTVASSAASGDDLECNKLVSCGVTTATTCMCLFTLRACFKQIDHCLTLSWSGNINLTTSLC